MLSTFSKSFLHSTKQLIDESKNVIDLTEDEFNFITNLQNEVHNVAIEYNRKLRDNAIT